MNDFNNYQGNQNAPAPSYGGDNSYGGDRPGFSAAPAPQPQPAAPSYGEGFGQQTTAAPGYGAPAPTAAPGYGAPQPTAAPAYQPAPAPSYQAPAPAPSYGNNGGNSYGSSSGGYGSGNGGQRGFGGQGANRFGKPPLTPQELAALRLPKCAVVLGNYKTPEHVIPLFQQVIGMLKHHGFKIRVEPSDGIGMATLQAAGDAAELYLPFKKGFERFSNAHSSFNGDECKEFTRRYVPNFGGINEKQHSFYFRTTRMVLGKNCTAPAQISIIWSEDGVESVATHGPKSGQAGQVAILSKAMSIPVFNLNNPGAFERIKQYLEG